MLPAHSSILLLMLYLRTDMWLPVCSPISLLMSCLHLIYMLEIIILRCKPGPLQCQSVGVVVLRAFVDLRIDIEEPKRCATKSVGGGRGTSIKDSVWMTGRPAGSLGDLNHILPGSPVAPRDSSSLWEWPCLGHNCYTMDLPLPINLHLPSHHFRNL